ncbi:MAG TPA: LL-diaminopimelate aminotransferase [Nitrospiria bacterium]|nr:LL-diaminopimelate aminotransferase [Nitrospiria bacterium]
MASSYIQRTFAERIGGAKFGKSTKIYKFEKIKRAKAAAQKAHPGIELLDFGVGEPDDMAFPGVVEALQREAARWENRGYADNGIAEFKDAAARYLDRVFGASGIAPQTEVIHSIGSKPALAMLPACFINPGDVAIVTVPGYPVMATHTKWYGGRVVELPLTQERNFLPDLGALKSADLKRAKLLYLNYPNNPTGASATREFYQGVITFAKKHKLIVVVDAAYASLTYGEPPFSFLSLPGAKDVGVELHSLSKAYNMTGWRLGFVAGNPLVVSAFGMVKDNCDSGQFKAIQRAGIYALEHPEITAEIGRKYERRLRRMVDALGAVGFDVTMPRGSFFLYTGAPKAVKGGRKFKSAEEVSEFLITEKLISTVPWDDVGRYLRFSATFLAKDETDERRVLAELKSRLSDLGLVF